jgi:shikimate kinase
LSSDAITASRRPNLTTTGGQEEIEQLLAERTPLYRECATLIVDTEGKSISEVADEIAAGL